MAIKQGPGNFEQYNDPMGNELIALGRDGSVFSQALAFPDGTSQTTAAAGNTPAAANTILAGPTSGAAAAGSFRLLTGADIASAQLGAVAISGGLTSGITKQAINTGTLGTGDQDVFTVPAGKRAIIIFDFYNTAGTTTTYHLQVKKGGIGSYIRLTTDATVATNVAGANGFLVILEEGDIASLNLSQSGINFFGTVTLFPNTDGLKSVFFAGPFANGENIIYTCPPGKTATTVLTNNQISGSTAAGLVAVGNTSGGSLNYFLNVVKSGNTAGAASKQGPATAVLNNATTNISAAGSFALSAGDFLSLNASGAGAGFASLFIQEF